MNTQVSHRLSIHYPDWHKQPFRLSIDEIENPYLVFKEFFSCYNLVNVRACLWEWLHDGMHTQQSKASDLLHIYEHVEKLIEATWVLTREHKTDLPVSRD